jgi:hypothetical protein
LNKDRYSGHREVTIGYNKIDIVPSDTRSGWPREKQKTASQGIDAGKKKPIQRAHTPHNSLFTRNEPTEPDGGRNDSGCQPHTGDIYRS